MGEFHLAPTMLLNLSPTLEEEVEQNLRMIITTMAGSVPLDRAFGIDGAVVDHSSAIAQARLTGQIMTMVTKYEKRVQISEIRYEYDQESGRLMPIIAYTIRGDQA